MPKGIKPPITFHGQKGKSGRKSISEEAIKAATERIYKDVLKEMIPDTLLAEKHLELLTAPKKVRRFVKGDLESEYEEIDVNAIKSGLDMAYKLRGDYAPEKIDHTTKGDKIIDSTIQDLTNQLNDIYKGTSSRSNGGSAGTVGG